MKNSQSRNNSTKVGKKIQSVTLLLRNVILYILSDYKFLTFLPISQKMIKEEKRHQFVALKSMFLSGSVKRMKDIEKLYPSQVSKALKMNHSRYIQKLYNPEEFKFKNIKALANLINIDVQIILDVLIKESNTASKSVSKKNK